MFTKILDNIQKYLFFWLLGVVVSGLSLVGLFGGYAFSPLICLLAAIIMIYPSLVSLSFDRLKEAKKQHKTIAISLFFNFIVSPLLAIVLGYLFLQSEPSLRLGLFLLSLLPGGGMVTTWALRSGSDMPTTISIVLVNLLAAIFVFSSFFPLALNKTNNLINFVGQENSSCVVESISSGSVSCFLGGGEISPLKVAVPIVIIIIIPLLLAYLTQDKIVKKYGKEYFEKNKNFFGKLSNLGLLIVLFLLMGIKSNIVLFSNPEFVFTALLPVGLFYLILLALIMVIYLVFYKKNNIGKAFVWGSYLRYITLSLGIATSVIYQNDSLSLMVVVIVIAYFIQIPASFLLSKYFLNN